MSDSKNSAGIVYLVGAGPWSSDLITVRGEELLRKADCIVYDRLVNDRLLQSVLPGADLIYAGKKSGNHSKTQAEINELLATRAAAEQTVVRLKGGDPYLFGRGGEEALYLGSRGIEFEVVPGISSFYAAPAFAGIPLTHRDCAASFAVLTGHRRKESSGKIRIPLVDTLVILMGVGNIEKLVSRALEAGYGPDTPAAAIRRGTSARQEVLTSSLNLLPEKIADSGFSPPAVIIIGEVVDYRKQLSFFENKVLFGERIVVTRPPSRIDSITRRLEQLGAEVIHFPTIKIETLEKGPLREEIENLSSYNYLIFTSPSGVRIFLDTVLEKYDLRRLAGLKIATIGPGTAGVLEEYGLKADFIPSEYRAERILDFFPEDLNGENILIPRAKEARKILPDLLRERRAEVKTLPVYKTVFFRSDVPPEVRAADFDLITFTSSSTVKNFFEILGEEEALKILPEVETICIGPITAATLEDHGICATSVAAEYSIDGVIEAVCVSRDDGL